MYSRLLVVLCAIPSPLLLQAQTSVVNSKHNMSTSGPGTVVAATEGAVCVFCHTPHSASTAQTAAPLWNRQSSTATYTLYSSDYLTSLSYAVPAQPNAKSKLCLSCHDGTIALGTVYNAPGAGTSITMAGSVTTMPLNAGGYLGTDLSDDHPIGFTYDQSADPELVSRAWPWNTDVTLDPDASTGRLECHTCHDVHDNQYTHFLQMSNTNAALCTFCHSKTGWTGAAVVHRTSTQSYTPPGEATTTIGEWACRNCHTSHGAGTGGYLLEDVEEATCLQPACHGGSAPSSTSDIATAFGASGSVHPTLTTSGAHVNPETASNLAANRHAECWDCHNPHEAEGEVHDGSTRLIAASGGSGVLKGVWGVEPSYGPLATNSTNNDNVWSSVSSYSVVDPATTEYQICLKCHSDYLTGTHRNVAIEIDPRYSSYHGIISGGTSNPYCDSDTMEDPWYNTDANGNNIVWCSDCHDGNPNGTSPQGPHGSNLDQLLVASISSSASGTPLCLVCHKSSVYWGSASLNLSRYPHYQQPMKHRTVKGCFACHMYNYSDYPSATGGGDGKIFVHGMNKWYNKRETGTNVTGTGQAADAFVAGYIADIDFVNRTCWVASPGGESATNCGTSHTKNY